MKRKKSKKKPEQKAKRKTEQKAERKAQLKAQFPKPSSPISEKAAKSKDTKRVIEDIHKPLTLVQLIIGSRNTTHQHQIPDEENLKSKILQYFQGYSLFKGRGFWQEELGVPVIEEESFSILIATTHPKKVESLAGELMWQFEQISILLIKHEATPYLRFSKPKKPKNPVSTTATLPVTRPIVDKETPKGKAIVTMDVDPKKQR